MQIYFDHKLQQNKLLIPNRSEQEQGYVPVPGADFPILGVIGASGQYIIEKYDLSTLSLYYSNGLPELRYTVHDDDNTIKNFNFPKSNDIVVLYISNFQFKIKLEFRILSIEPLGKRKYSASAVYNIDYTQKFESFTGTSFEALKSIATKLRLGFRANSNTADSMKWQCRGLSYIDYIHHISDYSYLDNASNFDAWIDFNNHLCFKNFSIKNFEQVVLLPKVQTAIPENKNPQELADLVLTNSVDYANTSLHFDTYSLVNENNNLTISRPKGNSALYTILRTEHGSTGGHLVNYGFDPGNIHSEFHAAKLTTEYFQKTSLNKGIDIDLDYLNLQLYKGQTVKIKVYVFSEFERRNVNPNSESQELLFDDEMFIHDIEIKYSKSKKYSTKLKLRKYA